MLKVQVFIEKNPTYMCLCFLRNLMPEAQQLRVSSLTACARTEVIASTLAKLLSFLSHPPFKKTDIGFHGSYAAGLDFQRNEGFS